MVEIELSTIPDSDVDLRTLSALVNEFSETRKVHVTLHTMTWSEAWTELMTIASHGRGPHVSHIGGTWTSSLIMMNALRPFQPAELDALGGSSAFMQPTWMSTSLNGEDKIYAVPWTGYIYVICYRKDLLKQAGINVDTAFGTVEALSATIEQLSASKLNIPWLNPPIVAPYNDYLHTAASWVWGAGGQFLDESGRKLIFDNEPTIRGISYWLDAYRAVRPEHEQIGTTEGLALFADGKAAAVLTDIRAADSFFATDALPLVRDNLGVATLTDVPWCGGGNFVIWNHARGVPEQEKAAVALVQFLSLKQSQLLWAREVKSMPARMDVLDEIYKEGHPLRDAVMLAAHKGMSYLSAPLWRRVEYQLSLALGAIMDEARRNPDKKSSQIVREHLEPLARRLNLAFSG